MKRESVKVFMDDYNVELWQEAVGWLTKQCKNVDLYIVKEHGYFSIDCSSFVAAPFPQQFISMFNRYNCYMPSCESVGHLMTGDIIVLTNNGLPNPILCSMLDICENKLTFITNGYLYFDKISSFLLDKINYKDVMGEALAEWDKMMALNSLNRFLQLTGQEKVSSIDNVTVGCKCAEKQKDEINVFFDASGSSSAGEILSYYKNIMSALDKLNVHYKNIRVWRFSSTLIEEVNFNNLYHFPKETLNCGGGSSIKIIMEKVHSLELENIILVTDGVLFDMGLEEFEVATKDWTVLLISFYKNKYSDNVCGHSEIIKSILEK